MMISRLVRDPVVYLSEAFLVCQQKVCGWVVAFSSLLFLHQPLRKQPHGFDFESRPFLLDFEAVGFSLWQMHRVSYLALAARLVVLVFVLEEDFYTKFQRHF